MSETGIGQLISIKPLSVNECWQGRRFKTPKYKSYEKELLLLIKKVKMPAPPYEISLRFGVSSPLSDWDNPVKPFQDVLQKRLGFNDKEIVKAVVEKRLVKKGEEYVSFCINTAA